MSESSPHDILLDRLRGTDLVERTGVTPGTPGASVLGELSTSGLRMAAIGGPLAEVYHRALRELVEYCVRPVDGSGPVLHEGGVYRGSWLESTGTISAEVLSRFLPSVARDTFLLFAGRGRDDGLLPYKVTEAGPAYRQIQIVTPLARSVWNHYHLTGRDSGFLRTMYDAMAANDAWLARYRDTGESGCVEAFCTFDTGHDLSPRFWHVPDTNPDGDPRRYAAESPILPLRAPDLTANVACQRGYLARMATALGEDPAPWDQAARATRAALFANCYDTEDATFYDRDAQGEFVRVQSDVLLRVLACEIGDAEFFAGALRRYLLNTRKFFARYPFTSLALDDPRFDHDFTHNSWGGPSNFLSLIRAPHAFEHHARFVELSWAMLPVLAAVCRMNRFPQAVNPWTGEPGFTEQYSPAILWLLDAVERLCGILSRPDGEVWFSGLLPHAIDQAPVADGVGYARRVDGIGYEFVTTTESVVYREGVEYVRFPRGWRLVTDRAGAVRAVIGLSARPVRGTLVVSGRPVDLTLAPNERVDFDERGHLTGRGGPGLVHPTYGNQSG
jgi:hypothetical protein